MSTWRKVCCCLAVAAGVSFTAFGGTTINVGSGETYTTITDAMTYVGTLGDDAFPVEIIVKTGTYAETGFTLDKAITVRGATGNPADVEIVDNAAGSRAFTLSDANAAVRDLTVSGMGLHTSSGYGGHVNMTAGTVENCILTDGCAGTKVSSGSTAASNGRGGNVWMSGGRLVRCQVLKGMANDYNGANTPSYGAGIFASGGVVESCFICENSAYPNTTTVNVFGGGLYADGPVTVANCTFVNNVAGAPAASAGGIQLGKDTAKVVNCIFYNNGGTLVTEIGGVNLGRFSHCASTVMNDEGDDCRIIGEQDFVSAAMGDFHLMCDSELVDGGTRDSVWYPESASTLDLDGLPRFSGNEVDVGCFEVDQRALVCSGRAEAYAVFEGSNLNFIASHLGPSATVTYKWDFGDDETLETQESVAVHAYAASGLYTVSVCASMDGGLSWSDPFVLATKVVVAPDVIFVDSASASPTFPYKTRETAAKTFRDALAALTNNISGGYATVPGATIRVCSGTHADTGVVLRSGVRIVGDTGNPADVEIVDNVEQSRAFTIEHEDALISGLTVSGRGWHWNDGQGGHVRMTAGTVENCILTDGCAGSYHSPDSSPNCNGQGGNVWMSGGRLVRCQVLNGKANDYNGVSKSSLGSGVYAEGGVVENCLVRGNSAVDESSKSNPQNVLGAGLYANGPVTVANCTFVDNVAGVPATSAGGIQLGKDTAKAAKIVNCIFYNNGGTTVTEFGGDNLDRFSHCASTVTNASCDTWQMMTGEDFVSYDSQDFHLKQTSLLMDAGSEDSDWYPPEHSPYDLDGLDRVSGKAIDLGCYEVDQSGFSCSGHPSVYGTFEGSNVTFTAKGVGGSNNYVFEWDFGDKTTSGPVEAICTHVYQTSGLFTMRVKVSDDGGANWSDWTTVAAKIVVTPKEMFVNASATSSTFPYRTPETGALTLGEALAALTNDTSEGCAYTDGAIVRVCPGTYTETGFLLKHGISVIGQTGNPADVKIVDNVEQSRAFTLEHADAVVSGLTVSGRGWHWNNGQGGHVRMTAGTVENCILTGGCAGSYHNPDPSAYCNGRGGNVWMSGGRLVRCQVLNGKANDYNGVSKPSLGSGVYAEGGVVENCLVRGNSAVDESSKSNPQKVLGAGLYANGPAAVVNCTFVDNVPGVPPASAGGIQLGSAEAKVVNCVFFNNGGEAVREFGSDHLDRFDHCASSVGNDQCDMWQVIDAMAFRGWEKREEKLGALTPKSGKPLAGTGTDRAGYAAAGAISSVDLLGKSRYYGKCLDIGCVESQVGGMALIVR